MSRLTNVALAACLALQLACPAVAYNNGMAKKPPMGWQTWCSVGPCGEDHCTDGQIREMADTLVSTGMRDLGYDWIVLDDCWHPSRAANGSLVPFPRFFPHGMAPVIDYVHSKGLHFGLYTSVGDKTCHGGWSPGSLNHWQQDADTFASWGVDYVKIDYCGSGTSPEGHHNMSKAMNATGRHMVLALCRGPYQGEQDWGYAPDVAQVWRATGDHHDNFGSVMAQVNSVKGKGKWSGPHNWAYLDMMMTGGQGCNDQCTGSGKGDTAICNFTTPRHCPGQTDAEYRTEASLYAVVSSPMMVGTDIRLMTPIMKELLLNPEMIAINQDYLAPPGDAVPGCAAGQGQPPPPPICQVTLTQQTSKHACTLGETFGCVNGTSNMWVKGGCRGVFSCDGQPHVQCGTDGHGATTTSCACVGGPGPDPTEVGEVWVRHLSGGDLAVAMPNLGSSTANVSFCLDSVGWKHGATAHARDVWKKKDLGAFSGQFSATLESHDTMLLRISPSASRE